MGLLEIIGLWDGFDGNQQIVWEMGLPEIKGLVWWSGLSQTERGERKKKKKKEDGRYIERDGDGLVN